MQPCPRPLGAPLRYAGCHGFSPPLVAAVQPCIVSWHSPPALPLLHSVTTASLISCGLLRYTTIHSFATSLRYAYGSFSRALPCPQGFLIVHGRHPAGPLRLRLRFWLPAVEMHIIAALWVQVCPTVGRQAIKNLALRNTDRCFPVRTSQSQPQPAVGMARGGASSKDIYCFGYNHYVSLGVGFALLSRYFSFTLSNISCLQPSFIIIRNR